IAGTRTTPPPMPRRPTSTPTQSPSRRMTNVMASGARWAYCPNSLHQAFHFPLSGLWRQPPIKFATLENAPLFLFARNLLYLHVFVTSAGGLLAALQQPQRGIPENVNLLAPARPGQK